MGRVRDRYWEPELGRHALEVFVEAGERGDPPVDGLGGFRVGEHPVAERQDVANRDREEPGRFVGPLEPEEQDEVHHVLAVGPLGVLRGSSGDPPLEDFRDRAIEVSDLGLDRRGVPTGEDRRQLGPRLAHRHQLGRFLLVHDPVLWRPDLRGSVALPCSFGPS